MRFRSSLGPRSLKAVLVIATVGCAQPRIFGQVEMPPLPPGVQSPLLPLPDPTPPLQSEGHAPYPKATFRIGSIDYAADQVIVKFKAGVDEAIIRYLLRANGLEQKGHILSIGARLLTFPPPMDARFFVPLLQ